MNPFTDLFAFIKNGEVAERMRELGYLPWWSDPNIKVSLFRPLTALTHMLDYALWPDNFALQHLQSLAWFGAGVALVAALYRMVPGTSAVAALLAGLLFAVDDSHTFPAGWIANRNALLCLVFGVLTLLAHLRWRKTRRRRWMAWALLFFATGLGCGEATLGALAYIAAWHLTMEKDIPRKQALTAFLPYLVVVLGWRLMYNRLGYGTTGSDLYVDPGQHPLLFARAVLERWPILAAGNWFLLPADLWIMLSRFQRLVLLLVSLLLVSGLVALLRPLLRQSVARFWVLGMTFSLIPVCAAFPMDRLLIYAGIGVFGLLALLAESELLSDQSAPSRLRKIAVILLIVLHGPLAALLLTVRTLGLPVFADFFAAASRQAPAGPETTGQTFVYVNGNDFPVFYSRIIRTADNASTPKRLALLASMLSNNRISRTDDHTLVITPNGGFLYHSLDRLLASSDRAFRPGKRISRPDFVAEVIGITRDGRPASVSFRFRRPLEDPSLRWLCWQGRRLVPFRLPNVGEATDLAANGIFP
jgi:hypothetical protein